MSIVTHHIQIEDGATWRAGLALEEWHAPLAATLEAMRRLFTCAAQSDIEQLLDRALAVVQSEPGDGGHDRLARRVLRSALEQRRIRHRKLGLTLASEPWPRIPAPGESFWREDSEDAVV